MYSVKIKSYIICSMILFNKISIADVLIIIKYSTYEIIIILLCNMTSANILTYTYLYIFLLSIGMTSSQVKHYRYIGNINV